MCVVASIFLFEVDEARICWLPDAARAAKPSVGMEGDWVKTGHLSPNSGSMNLHTCSLSVFVARRERVVEGARARGFFVCR
jgi:hypothetical protein